MVQVATDKRHEYEDVGMDIGLKELMYAMVTMWAVVKTTTEYYLE
jgi:hypothetical protein